MSSEHLVGAAVIGAVLDGRYRLAGRVGRGGMADVWAAEDLLLHRPVAVKVFRFDADGVDEQRIHAEMRTLAGLNHPGVVTVYDAGTAPDPASHEGTGTPYLVMELVAGQTLAARLARGPLPPAEVAALTGQLADTLAFVHGRGIVHRDIKPANILLQPAADAGGPLAGQQPERARLTDFGVARLVDSTRLTDAGRALGTANYLSPEQATGAAVGPSSDVYSLGLVALECLTGRVAYPGVGVEAALARLHRPPDIPAHLDKHWQALLGAMTARDPAARPNATDVARTVADHARPTAGVAAGAAVAEPTTVLLSGRTAGDGASTKLLPITGGPPASTTAASPRPRAARPGRWLWAAVFAAAALVVVTFAIAVTHTGGNGPQAPTPSKTAPAYPSVPGRLGDDLRHLQEAVG